MKTNRAGLDLIKQFEGLRLKAYQDSVGVWTIGYGHTKGVKAGMTINETTAEAFLVNDLESAEADVARLVKIDLNANEHAALVSFVFNLGGGALSRSTLLRKLNTGDRLGAASEFQKWVKAGGVTLAGLVKRRKAERDLFLA
jgi:lysozyme